MDNVVWIGYSDWTQEEVNALAASMTDADKPWPKEVLQRHFYTSPILVGQSTLDTDTFDIYIDTSFSYSYKKIPLELLVKTLVDFSKVTTVDLLMATESAGIVSVDDSRIYREVLSLLDDYMRSNNLELVQIMDTDRREYGGEDEIAPADDDIEEDVDQLLTSTWVITVRRNIKGATDE